VTPYPTKSDLETAWTQSATLHLLPLDTTRADAAILAGIMVKGKAIYVPHLYRGGYVIRGFGFSTERITEGYVSAVAAGNPELV
jgi:hypothetical protein